MTHQRSTLGLDGHTLETLDLNKGFDGPPTPWGQEQCGFDKGRSLAVK